MDHDGHMALYTAIYGYMDPDGHMALYTAIWTLMAIWPCIWTLVSDPDGHMALYRPCTGPYSGTADVPAWTRYQAARRRCQSTGARRYPDPRTTPPGPYMYASRTLELRLPDSIIKVLRTLYLGL